VDYFSLFNKTWTAGNSDMYIYKEFSVEMAWCTVLSLPDTINVVYS